MTTPAARHRAFVHDDDAGLSLVEVIVAITILGLIMTAASLFFVNALKSSAGHSQRQQSIALTQQALETAESVKTTDLVHGRQQSVVTALNGSDTAGLTSQDILTCPTSPAAVVAACPLNYDPTALSTSTEVVKTTQTITVSGTDYVVRTFINGCWFQPTPGSCTQTYSSGAQGLYRITVDTKYTTKGAASSCKQGCSYNLSALSDGHDDPQFKTNISTPSIASFVPGSVGAGAPTIDLDIQGSGFIAGSTVTLAAGGGTLGAITGNNGTDIHVPLTPSSTPGNYVVTVIAPDGGRDSRAYTVNPAPTVTASSPATITAGVATQVTLTGANYVAGAAITVPAGTTVGSTSVSSTTSAKASITFPVVGGNFPVTITNLDGGFATTNISVKSAPTITSINPGTFLNGTAAAFTLNVSGLQSTASLAVGSGVLSGVSVNAASGTVSGTYTGSSNGPVTFALTNGDSGAATKTANVITAPTVTGVNPSSVAFSTSTSTTVHILGSGFANGATAAVMSSPTTVFNGTPTFVNAGDLSFSYPNNKLAKGAGTTGSKVYTLTVTVTNPDTGTATNSTISFTVTW